MLVEDYFSRAQSATDIAVDELCQQLIVKIKLLTQDSQTNREELAKLTSSDLYLQDVLFHKK